MAQLRTQLLRFLLLQLEREKPFEQLEPQHSQGAPQFKLGETLQVTIL